MVADKFQEFYQRKLVEKISRYLSPLKLQNISESRIAYIILFLILATVMFFRRPDALLNPQPWAEDGKIFIQQAIEYSFSSLFISYAGYFHAIPRLVTLLSLQFGLGNTPLIMNFLSLIIASISVSFLFNRKFRFIIRNDLLRFICAIFIVLLPVQEIFLNITNIQWFLLIYLTLWASDIIFNIESSLQLKNQFSALTIFQVIFTVLAFLTTPLSFILIPFLIWELLKKIRRNSVSISFAILYLLPITATVTYFMACFFNNTSKNAEIPSLINIARLFSAQVITRLFFSNSDELVQQFGYDITYLISIIIVLILIMTAINKKDFVVDLWLWTLIILYLLFVGVFRSNVVETFSSIYLGRHERFFLFPMTLILIFFIRHFETFNINKLKYIIYFCLAIISLNLLPNYEIQPFEDLDFKSYAEHFDPDGQFSCKVPINPQGWSINIPCKQNSSYYPTPDWGLLKRVEGGIIWIDTVGKKQYSQGNVIIVDTKKEQLVSINGWATDDKAKNGTIKKFVVFNGGNEEIVVPTKMKLRPDVANYFGVENYIQSGWEATITSNEFKDCFNISLRIMRANGEEYYELYGEKPICFI